MQTKKIVLSAIAAALVVSVAAPSFAAPGREGPGRHGGRAMAQEVMFVRLLKTADANKDAKVTKEEVMARHDALFEEIDADKDGNLIPGELRAFRKAKFEEFRENNPRPERAERREQREERRKEMAENGERPRGDREDRGHRWGNHGPRMGGLHFIRQADTDENGQFSKAETTAAVEKLFARMDRNKDGVISIDDMPDRPF